MTQLIISFMLCLFIGFVTGHILKQSKIDSLLKENAEALKKLKELDGKGSFDKLTAEERLEFLRLTFETKGILKAISRLSSIF